MEKLIKNTIIKIYCLRHCCHGTPKRAVHAEGGAVSINTKVKYEDTEITDNVSHRRRRFFEVHQLGGDDHTLSESLKDSR